jgi:hypothetical protein
MGFGVSRETLAAKFETIFPHLDERQRRLLMGAEARSLGHGGIRLVARAAGVREATVSTGVAELDAGAEPLGRVRRPGGGRKRAVELDPDLRSALLALVGPEERGDPMSPLRWTTKSTRMLAGELTRQGHRVGADTVADLLRDERFSLQGNAKTLEGTRHPDRDGLLVRAGTSQHRLPQRRRRRRAQRHRLGHGRLAHRSSWLSRVPQQPTSYQELRHIPCNTDTTRTSPTRQPRPPPPTHTTSQTDRYQVVTTHTHMHLYRIESPGSLGQWIMGTRVEELRHIKVNHPVVAPAPAPAHRHRIHSATARPIPVRVPMEDLFHPWLQPVEAAHQSCTSRCSYMPLFSSIPGRELTAQRRYPRSLPRRRSPECRSSKDYHDRNRKM